MVHEPVTSALGLPKHALLRESEPLGNRAAALVLNAGSKISTRLSFQTPKAWSTRAAVARVTVPLPCDCSAIQYPTLVSRCSQSSR